jgi:histidyl-tRNA synthetase
MAQFTIQPVRGTHDYKGDEYLKQDTIHRLALQIAQHHGYTPIATPIFEFSSVFKRSLGDASDVVSKEMYTFTDRNGEELTLRPEGTAAVARALISLGLAHDLPQKFYYCGPMFRYERPQKGRMRQFHQLALEIFGVESPQADAEVISLAVLFLKKLGIFEKTALQLNSLGDLESRKNYRIALVHYFEQYKESLSVDSQRRLQTNPLRILDSKAPQDQEIVKNAPLLQDFLTPSSQQFFQQVCNLLEKADIPFLINPHIVRGLDYYCHTTFEFITQELGAQGTVLAGGRYDGLVKMLGGPEVCGIGWAAGIERLEALANISLSICPKNAIIPLDKNSEPLSWVLFSRLQQAEVPCELDYSGDASKRLKRAHKKGAQYAFLVKQEEYEQGRLTVRNLQTGEQKSVTETELIQQFSSQLL